jgi:pyruvate dehydrogenase (quinone)
MAREAGRTVQTALAVYEAPSRVADYAGYTHAAYADLIGLRGIRVTSPDEVGPALDAALAADRPVVIEAVTDPEIACLPPHITFEQARALSGALIGRDPNALAIIRRSLRENIHGFLPQSH